MKSDVCVAIIGAMAAAGGWLAHSEAPAQTFPSKTIRVVVPFAPGGGESAWVKRAEKAFDFVARHMTVDGDLYHAWYQGDLQSVRILDDYAQMARAALSLYEATAEHAYLEQCERWVDTGMAVFADRESGALAFSADASLAARFVDGRDSVTPSGNGTMCEVLARLSSHPASLEAVLASCATT